MEQIGWLIISITVFTHRAVSPWKLVQWEWSQCLQSSRVKLYCHSGPEKSHSASFSKHSVGLHTEKHRSCSQIYPLEKTSAQCQNKEDHMHFQTKPAYCGHILTHEWICNLQNFVSLSHLSSFKLRVCFSLSLYLLREPPPPPSGPLARRFLSFSVMNHTCTHMQTHTFAFTHSHKLPST